MTQNSAAFEPIDPNVEDGTQLATRLDNQKESYLSTHKGPTAPGYMLAGGFWIQENAVDQWALMLKRPDGVSSVVYLFNPQNGNSDLVRGEIDLTPYAQKAVEETITAKWYFNADVGTYSDLSFARTSGDCYLTVPDGIALRVRNESGIAYGEFSLPGTAAPLTYTIMTREKGDARYTQSNNGAQTINGVLTVQEPTQGIIQIEDQTGDIGGSMANKLSFTSGGVESAFLGHFGGANGNFFINNVVGNGNTIFRNAATKQCQFQFDGVIEARIGEPGTTVGFDETVITREKGDARYPSVYTGSTANVTAYPIGHIVFVYAPNGGKPNRNGIEALWYTSSNSRDFNNYSSGGALAGTWRGRGGGDDFGRGTGQGFFLAQRVA